MVNILNMPSLSPSMEQGVIVSWEKQEGDFVNSGDLLAQVETDKAVVEYEALDEGFLRKILKPTGEVIQVGEPIAIFSETQDEDISQVSLPDASNGKPPSAEFAHNTAPPAATQLDKPEPTDTRIKASPLARKIAKEQGLDLATITGSGPNGRIVKADLQNLNTPQAVSSSTPAPKPQTQTQSDWAKEGNYEVLPLTMVRKTIAGRLQESTREIPHFYLTVKVCVDELVALRKQINSLSEVKVSLNDMIIKASSVALANHPVVNSRYTEEGIVQFEDANIAFAVATDDALFTPIVRAVNKKGLGQIAKETKDFALRAREKRLAIEEFTGGTFGTSNLGMFQIEQFTAIINPPQSANLAIAQALTELQLDSNGEVYQSKQMKLTLSCDHRIIDGATGAKFLKELKKILENPLFLTL